MSTFVMCKKVQIEIRRGGFGLDVTVGDPTATVTLGGATAIVALNGPQVHVALDVGLERGLHVDGTIGISADSAVLFPGLGPLSATIEDDDPNDSLPGVSGTIGISDGSQTVPGDF